MVKKVIHKNLAFWGFVLALVLANLPIAGYSAHATTCTTANGVTTCEEDTNFQVNIGEFISISLTEPQNWATGNINELLRNKVTLNVSSNYSGGFQASMASKTTTNLVNQAKNTSVIQTLPADTTAQSFTPDRWGYSLTDNDAGLSSATYKAMSTSAIPLITKAQSATVNSKDVYFGAKASMATDSGTYANTVIFTVVSSVVDNTETPSNTPVTPRDTSTNNPSVAYDSTNDRTVATTTTTSGSGTGPITGSKSTTTTQISKGDVTTSYAAPQGVTTSSVSEGTPLATGLAVTAGIAAMTGAGFFIAAKRSDKNDIENKK